MEVKSWLLDKVAGIACLLGRAESCRSRRVRRLCSPWAKGGHLAPPSATSRLLAMVT